MSFSSQLIPDAGDAILAERPRYSAPSRLLPLSAKLERFTCFCGLELAVGPMDPNTTRITSCECGRRWRQQT